MYTNDIFLIPQHRRDSMRANANRQHRLMVLIEQKVEEIKKTPMGRLRTTPLGTNQSPEVRRAKRTKRKSAYDRFLESQINS